MSIIPSLPINLQNGTTADATQVMANFNAIMTDVNTNAANNGTNANITALTGLTTPLSTAQGGLGVASPTAHGVLVGEGSSAVITVGPATAGQALISKGASADPGFVAMWPVGSVYINMSNNTNPGTLFGFGTWVALPGLVLVGAGTGTDSNGATQTFTAGTQVGEYVHTLAATELPVTAYQDSGHVHPPNAGGNGFLVSTPPGFNYGGSGSTFNVAAATGSATASITNPTGGGAHNNVQPVIGAYMWYRSA